MLIRTSRGLNSFFTEFQFKKELLFENDKYYEFEFNYLINYGKCSHEDVELTIYLYDIENFKEILFPPTNDQVTFNDRWNKFTQCFQILGGSYFLFIEADSRSCEIADNEAFFAIDNLLIQEIAGENLEKICLNFGGTEATGKTTIYNTEFSTESTYSPRNLA